MFSLLQQNGAVVNETESGKTTGRGKTQYDRMHSTNSRRRLISDSESICATPSPTPSGDRVNHVMPYDDVMPSATANQEPQYADANHTSTANHEPGYVNDTSSPLEVIPAVGESESVSSRL